MKSFLIISLVVGMALGDQILDITLKTANCDNCDMRTGAIAIKVMMYF